jgi:hypothetical protein
MDPPISPHFELWLPSFTSFLIYYSESLLRGFRVVTGSLSTFVAVPLFGCLTVQLNTLTHWLYHRIQLHLIKYNWPTDYLINSLQQIDAIKLSLTSLYTSLIDASNFTRLLEYFAPTLSSNFHLTFILLIHSSLEYYPTDVLFTTHSLNSDSFFHHWPTALRLTFCFTAHWLTSH